MSLNLHVSYDKPSDVLYLSTRTGARAYSSEERPGMVWRYDMKDRSIIGVTIIDFSTYWRPRIGDLTREVAKRFCVPENFIRDTLNDVD